MRRYDHIWYDRQTNNYFLVALDADGFANRAAGPYPERAVRYLLGSKRVDGARDLADKLNDLPPSRLSDVTERLSG